METTINQEEPNVIICDYKGVLKKGTFPVSAVEVRLHNGKLFLEPKDAWKTYLTYC